MVKELLENSLDAHSTRILVEIENGGRSLIRISDNGIGLEKEKLHDLKSLGLIGMRERVMDCRGSISIKGTSGSGTVLKISLPLENREERQLADIDS